MKILIYDKLQDATGVPAAVLTPALSDTYTAATTFTATWAVATSVDAIGIGYTDATTITITTNRGNDSITIDKSYPYHNGLYIIDIKTSGLDTITTLTVTHNGTYIGRVAAGKYRKLGTSPTKEIGFYTTNEIRETLSGQVIPGAGGYNGRRFVATVPYKIDSDIYDDIETAYTDQIQKGFPFFMYLDDEQHKLPTNMLRFYASTDVPISLLQSSSYEFYYSYKFNFYEKF